MKKTMLMGALVFALAGCKYGLPVDDPNAIQPVFEVENYDAQQLKEATRKAVSDLFFTEPWLIKEQHKYMVASAYSSKNYDQTYKLGRAIGAGATEGFAQKAKYTRHINLRPNMIKIANKGQNNEFLEVTREASDYAIRMGADTIIAINYTERNATAHVTMNVIRAVDNKSLIQYSYEINGDIKVEELSKHY